MITSIRGIVQQLGENEITLEVGGVGIQIDVPASVLSDPPLIGTVLFLQTHLAVKEDSLTLYGFSTTEERELFELLIRVSGVGPRLALATLSTLSPDAFRSAIASNQPEALARVPGIGKKTAEKIVFHLHDQLQAPGIADAPPSGVDTEVLAVLTSLGYSLVEAQAAVQSIGPDGPEDVEDRVKLALKFFATP